MTELETAPAPPSSVEFRVDLDLFEGPLDLLLFLIRKNELEITALALAQITSQYLAFLEVFRGLNISVAGEYLVHAATLVELKSSTLLPGKKLEDDLELEAATQELLAQLRERSGLRGLAEALGTRQEQVLLRWARPGPGYELEPEVLLGATPAELCYSLEEALRAARRPRTHDVRLEEWSVLRKMQELRAALERLHRVSLSEMLRSTSSRPESVALLLAALELAKSLRPVRLEQRIAFGEIEIVLEAS